MKPQVFSLLASTKGLGKKIATEINGTHIHLKQNVSRQLAATFQQGHPVIAIMAAGIVIRSIAPFLQSKQTDAPVISVSLDGAQIVPLIGGHHGANRLADKIAKATGGQAIITTASDNQLNVSLDEPPTGYSLTNPDDFKSFMVSALDGKKIKLNSLANWLTSSNLPIDDKGSLQISVTEKRMAGSKTHLVYCPKSVVIGIGCERGVSSHEISTLVGDCLNKSDLAKAAIACIATIDLKSDEKAINQLAVELGVPVRVFTATELKEQASRLQNPSDIVMAEVGCPGVAEGACLAATGPDSNLVLAKIKSARATCAIAVAPTPVLELPGRARGKLCVVGIGPGSLEWRSPQATDALVNASDWVGYGLYLDLIADLKSSQKEHRFDLGKEEKRVRHAFELAGQGRDVALVCSGDAAIYAMAALAYEVLDKGELSAEQARADLQVLPGISAFQAASARAGAIIGHDFCTISLSDLLTPWASIEQRLHAAAKGDFNVAFYNPRSMKRTDQLKIAIDILTPHRTPDTPVIIASNLGRPTEAVKTVRLADFEPENVDMLTIVLVGSSQSIAIKRGDGETYCYTPRGYANKTQKEK